MGRPPSDTQSDIVRRINLTLEGPVAEIMAQLVPELKKLPRRGVVEHILDDPDLLDRCFKAFRANSERFGALLVDEYNVPVTDAEALLSCGRSLDDVVAMVVRTHAKRHFRKRLDGETRALHAGTRKSHDAASKENRGLMGRLVQAFFAGKASKTKGKSRGEVLYDAFKEHLRHDWQVPLVPEYSTLSPQMVKRLGARILDYKVPEDIRRLRDNPKELPVPSTLPESIPAFLAQPAESASASVSAPKKPVAAAGAGEGDRASRMPAIETEKPQAPTADRRARLAEILTPDQKRIRGAAFTMILLDPQVRAALPNAEQTVRITGLLSEMGGLPAKMLVGDLGMRSDQLAVTVITLFDILGEDMFRRSFGVPGNLDYVGKFVERAKAAGISQDTDLKELAAFVAKMFSQVRKPPSEKAVVG